MSLGQDEETDTTMKTHYEKLGLPESASAEEIKKEYRQRAKKLHPDINQVDEERMKALNQAYDVLGDVEKKKAYDKQLRTGRASAEAQKRAERARAARARARAAAQAKTVGDRFRRGVTQTPPFSPSPGAPGTTPPKTTESRHPPLESRHLPADNRQQARLRRTPPLLLNDRPLLHHEQGQRARLPFR